MNLILSAFAVALWVAAAPCALAADAIHETRPAAGFNRIEIDGQAEVVLRQGTVEGVAIDASAEALRHIETSVHERTLSIDIVDQRRWWDWVFAGSATRTPRITIDLIQLERLEAAGSVKFNASSLKSDDLRLDFAGACTLRIADLQANRLKVESAGAVKAEIAGKVGSQFVELSGASSYLAGELVSDNASLQVSGAGKALINAAKTLKVEISGAGVVKYIGNPKLEQDITGVGKISRVESP